MWRLPPCLQNRISGRSRLSWRLRWRVDAWAHAQVEYKVHAACWVLTRGVAFLGGIWYSMSRFRLSWLDSLVWDFRWTLDGDFHPMWWPPSRHPPSWLPSPTPYTWAEKSESFERINSIRETNGNFDSCNSCKRLVPSRLHELHESKFTFVSRIEFIRSKLSNFSAHVYGVTVNTARLLLFRDRSDVDWRVTAVRFHDKSCVAWHPHLSDFYENGSMRYF